MAVRFLNYDYMQTIVYTHLPSYNGVVFVIVGRKNYPRIIALKLVNRTIVSDLLNCYQQQKPHGHEK